ncbi:inositol monophosphatase family protein [Brucella thiophenivorans]|uniref:Inositol-1-monophosphatase n=1 Tax=Brucella thiophenivorans TaxID=571255 RepID=A0A256FJC8_9HYPH|nr:inositol monophosphatase family protein [Brucella thiophenivorans]OYR14953.1 inositol monophosphatase family protein [Brucella thiophenivorans]
MSTSELDHLVRFAAALADKARETLADESTSNENTVSDIEVKPDRSLVTKYDRAIEHRLRAEIRKRYPHHGIIGEEEGSVDAQASHVWVLDPIDGTAPFIVGIPVWGTLIALAIDGVPQVGVIDNPVLDTRWIGAAGQATQLNGQSVRCRPCASLATALMTNSNQDYMSADQLPALNALRRRTANRVYGGACLNYGRLAEGRTDLAIDAGQQIYDFAPYRPIIEGAGGKITDWNGQPLTLSSNGTILAAGDERCHTQALEVVVSSLEETNSAA